MKELFALAERDSKQVHALISLLRTCALRIQDAVGLTFSDVLDIEPNEDGFRTVTLEAKKTSERTVTIDQGTANVIIAYKFEKGAADDACMFEPGHGTNPANKWVKMLRKFYKQRGHDVKSHDFRVSQATDFYNETKDIEMTRRFMNHSDIRTTQRYLKTAQEVVDKTTQEFLKKKQATKRQRTSVINQ